jgi:hypothetical protein
MADEATRRFQAALADPATEETAVFLRTEFGSSRLGLILASRNDGGWTELYRWSDTWRGLGVSRVDVIN